MADDITGQHGVKLALKNGDTATVRFGDSTPGARLARHAAWTLSMASNWRSVKRAALSARGHTEGVTWENGTVARGHLDDDVAFYTGKGPDGKLIPMHFIEIVTVKHNGKVVINGQTSQSVSRNPVFAFRLKGAKPGDKLEISWLDNEGESNKIDGAIA